MNLSRSRLLLILSLFAALASCARRPLPVSPVREPRASAALHILRRGGWECPERLWKGFSLNGMDVVLVDPAHRTAEQWTSDALADPKHLDLSPTPRRFEQLPREFTSGFSFTEE